MPRDYEKESAWRKSKYKRLVADIEPETAEIFLEKLTKDKTAYSDWLKDRINEYIKGRG